jgi:hypothetical protein
MTQRDERMKTKRLFHSLLQCLVQCTTNTKTKNVSLSYVVSLLLQQQQQQQEQQNITYLNISSRHSRHW